MFHNVWPFLGSLGRLVEVPFTASESASRADRYVESTTVEGRRRVQVLPSAPRSWSVDVSGASASELAGLYDFASGAWGNGPFRWVSVDAQVGNVLTPRQSIFADRVSSSYFVSGGPVLDSDGAWAPVSLVCSVASGWVPVWQGVPAVPGRAVTFSADVSGSDPQVVVSCRDSSGAQLSAASGVGSGGAMQRVSVSIVPPAGTASLWVGFHSSVTRAARPQVTWTEGAVPYASGRGCAAAVLDGLSEDLLVATGRGPISRVSFTVLEVS